MLICIFPLSTFSYKVDSPPGPSIPDGDNPIHGLLFPSPAELLTQKALFLISIHKLFCINATTS